MSWKSNFKELFRSGFSLNAKKVLRVFTGKASQLRRENSGVGTL